MATTLCRVPRITEDEVAGQPSPDAITEWPVQYRGGNREALAGEENAELVALDEAIAWLNYVDEQQAHVVEWRYFGGLSIEESAEVLGVSPTTAKREWTMARAWLHARSPGDGA